MIHVNKINILNNASNGKGSGSGKHRSESMAMSESNTTMEGFDVKKTIMDILKRVRKLEEDLSYTHQDIDILTYDVRDVEDLVTELSMDKSYEECAVIPDEGIDISNGSVGSVSAEENKHYYWIPKDISSDEGIDISEKDTYGKTKNDPVNHPSHYCDGQFEVIDFIEAYQFPFCIGNAVKYISRAGKKDEDKYIEDLEKAEFYLNKWHTLYLNKPYVNWVNYLNLPNHKKINVQEYCKDKKLPFDLAKCIHYIVLERVYDAYLCLHTYLLYLKELGHEP